MLMTYDLHGAWDTNTGYNAPLFSRRAERGNEATLNVDWAVREWLNRGCPKDKLVVGLATYGRSFTLRDARRSEVGAPARGPGKMGLCTGVDGFLAYYEICDRIRNYGWRSHYDDEQKANYIVLGDQWVGYDSVESLKVKTEYVVEKKLRGAMVWTYDLDDFRGDSCQQGKYPLINAIKEVLSKSVTTPTPSPGAPTISTASKPATTPPITTTPTTKPTMEKIFVCYYTNWAQYRPNIGRFTPENIDPFLCTHIHYAFAVIKEGVLKPFEWNDDDSPWGKVGNYRKVSLRL